MEKQYAKFVSETEIEFAPLNKGNILNYASESNKDMLLADGYKEFISAEKPDTDRLYNIKYVNNSETIDEIISFIETEQEYTARKKSEKTKEETDPINAELNDLDLKRIRAVCEPSLKDETTGQTWLDYYNALILEKRNQLKEIYEKAGADDDITQ